MGQLTSGRDLGLLGLSDSVGETGTNQQALQIHVQPIVENAQLFIHNI